TSPLGADDLSAFYKKQGYDGRFPRELNYTLLTYHGLGEFQGKQVPQMIFFPRAGNGHAEVRVLSEKEFDLDNIAADFQSPPGYPFTVQLWKDAAGCAEIIVFHGEGNGDWLRAEPLGGAGAN
ncbi:MAG: hypothetical protein ACRD36_03610, partial [Candidatus Acidiferrum sp.]